VKPIVSEKEDAAVEDKKSGGFNFPGGLAKNLFASSTKDKPKAAFNLSKVDEELDVKNEE